MIIPEELWQHQKDVIKPALARPSYALFFQQGTGKTPTMVTILRNIFMRHGRPLKTLVFCPGIVIPNWEDEINKWSKCGPMVQMVKGTRKKKLEQIADRDKHIFVTNYEALRSEGLFWEWTNTKKDTRKIIPRGYEVLILDESHRAKNPTGMQTKLMIRLSNTIHYKYLLTGTPYLNSEMDIWAQFRILDGGHRFGDNYYSFRNKYFVDKNAGMPSQKHYPDWALKPGMVETLRSKVYEIASRVEKKDCLDLPPLVITARQFDLTGKQAAAYKSMEKNFIAWVEDVRRKTVTPTIAQTVLTRGLRLLQISSGYATDDEGEEISFEDNARLKALEDILVDVSGKVIIWAVFKKNYLDIARVCEKLDKTYCFLTGQQNQKAKEASVEIFRNGRTEVIIANPGAGGTGVNLTEAPLAIWFSRNFSLENRLQALARNHRGGSEMHDKITSIDLVASNTIEGHVLDALGSKENMAEALLRRS